MILYLWMIFSSYILMVPFDSQDLKGVVYVWIGGLAEHEDAVVAEKIAYKMYQVNCQLIHSNILFYIAIYKWTISHPWD